MALVQRGVILLTVTMILSACTRDGGVSSYLAGGCVGASPERFEGIDWDKVRRIKMRIRQDEYSPMVLTLTQEQAYVMSIENADDDNHDFRASEFFQSVAMAKASVGDEVYENGCIDSVSLGPGQTAELRFVAVRDGRYDFEDNSLLLAFSRLGGASGSIAIQPKYVVYTPPTKLPEETPVVKPVPAQPAPGEGLFGPPPTDTEPAPGEGLFGPPPADTEQAPGESLFGPPTGQETAPQQPVTPAPSTPVEKAPTADIPGPPEEGKPAAKPADEVLGPPEEGNPTDNPADEVLGPPEEGNSAAKPNDDIFGEPIEIEPVKPEEERMGAPSGEEPQEPNDGIFGSPLEQSMG